jgi:hypothetical protein
VVRERAQGERLGLDAFRGAIAVVGGGLRVEPRMFESRLSRWSVRCAVLWTVDGGLWMVVDRGIEQGMRFLRWREARNKGEGRETVRGKADGWDHDELFFRRSSG